eukprot:CAMPEP_0177653916 /NCGR_PEP_ID=MMETSP0447-20121125/14008_1 /TAXON_ID=0 /ORGANISM="Stygamoeba regulata, Strain BSH-02190019" /LENGTH=336 /DNA_ID=CAMNT_0019157439 /DNA_START=184 /DNA_END=1194 /DNA_ORIENTATION=+
MALFEVFNNFAIELNQYSTSEDMLQGLNGLLQNSFDALFIPPFLQSSPNSRSAVQVNVNGRSFGWIVPSRTCPLPLQFFRKLADYIASALLFRLKKEIHQLTNTCCAELASEGLFCICITNGNYLFSNRAMNEVFGYEFNEPFLISKIFSPAWLHIFHRWLARILQGTPDLEYHFRITDPDGRERGVFQRNSFIWENGKVILLCGACYPAELPHLPPETQDDDSFPNLSTVLPAPYIPATSPSCSPPGCLSPPQKFPVPASPDLESSPYCPTPPPDALSPEPPFEKPMPEHNLKQQEWQEGVQEGQEGQEPQEMLGRLEQEDQELLLADCTQFVFD